MFKYVCIKCINTMIIAELGDYNPEEHVDNYVTELKILLTQTLQLEEKMMDIHKNELTGRTAAEVETLFLKKACVLDTYGVDPHPVIVNIIDYYLVPYLFIEPLK